MKKLVFMFVAVAAISFASCGNKAQAPVQDTHHVVTRLSRLLLIPILSLRLLIA